MNRKQSHRLAWQPIKTAPADIFLLVWCPDHFCYEYAIAAFHGEENRWITFEGGLPIDPPTHWTHLPDPPQEEQTAQAAQEGAA